jgi:hypothetical protein
MTPSHTAYINHTAMHTGTIHLVNNDTIGIFYSIIHSGM